MDNRVWQVLALKYDGRPHYTWPAELLEDDGEQLTFRSVVGGLLVHYTRGFEEPTRRPSDLIFWRDRWYNVFVNLNDDGSTRNFYCNVAMPLSIEGNTIKFVDLDLDVQIFPDGTYRVLDRDEYELHCIKYAYPDWLQQMAEQAVTEILALFEAREGPFGELA
jgi:uncharacterized protein